MAKAKDLTGQTFWYWTVIEKAENDNRGKSQWLCECKCGQRKVIRTATLNAGQSKSCGCYKQVACGGKIDLTGQVFGELTVVKESGHDKRGNVMWLCKCSCGMEKEIVGYSLRRGDSKSCGCKITQPREDLTGKRFGKLVVKSFYERKNGDFYWNCDCDCGGSKIAMGSSLRLGGTTSCGCNKKEGNPRPNNNTYEDMGDYIIGYTKKGEPFYFDKDDEKRVKEHIWHTIHDKYLYSSIVDENGNKNHVAMHRFITNCMDDNLEVDHKNGVVYDNRKQNLRVCTRADNSHNTDYRYKIGESGEQRIRQTGTNSWEVKFNNYGKPISRIFKDKQSAIEWRDMMLDKVYGEYNFNPEERGVI